MFAVRKQIFTNSFILLRLTSLWALYTLKRTLVTLVLMGHYLTYESLRHNQLYFTFKDHLSDGPLSFLPAPSPHLPRLAENWGAAELSPRVCVTSLHPPRCHLRSCQGSRPPGDLKVQSLGSPHAGPSTLCCFFTKVCDSPREPYCLLK